MGFDVCDNKVLSAAVVKALSAFYERVRTRPEQKSEPVQLFHLSTLKQSGEEESAVPTWNAFSLPAEKLFFIEALAPASGTASPDAAAAASARARFLSLLELASEAGCETAVLCLDRHSASLKEQLQAYAYLGFTPLEPSEKMCSDNTAMLLSYAL